MAIHAVIRGILASSAVACCCFSYAHAQDALAVATYGGASWEAEVETMYEPAAKKFGTSIKSYAMPTPTRIATLRAQVKSGNVSFDMIAVYGGVCEQLAQEGLTEPLDFSVIDKSGHAPELVGKNWIATIMISTVLAYNTKVYGENGPKTWADFWDVKKFPGRRAMQNRDASVEISLLADGVPPDKLYPVDLDRVIKKITEIKPHINAWWGTGAQATQLARDEEVDMLTIWTPHINSLIEEGSSFTYGFDKAFLVYNCIAIPKGAPHKDLAMKVIAEALSAERMADFANATSIGPANTKAFATGKISKEKAAKLNTSPENLKKQIIVNTDWWSTHFAEVQDRFNKMIQE